MLQLKKPLVLDLGWQTLALVVAVIYYLLSREKAVYLIDFTTFEPPESWKISPDDFVTIMTRLNCFSQESLDFQERMLKQSGVGPATAWPPSFVRVLKNEEPDKSSNGSRHEAEV